MEQANDKAELKPEEIKRCEECCAVFEPKELAQDGKWGHVCRAKNFRKEHRCESYLNKYVLTERNP